jgi:hypothetical protein
MEIVADYVGGDPAFPREIGGGHLVCAGRRLRFEYGRLGERSDVGPELYFAEIVGVQMGGKLMGRKKGWGKVLLFGAAGAAHQAATKGRRDTALRVQVSRDGEEITVRFAVDGAKGAAFVDAVNEQRSGAA